MTATITLLTEKGSPLSHTEMDNNFRALRNLVEVPTVAALRALGDGAIPSGSGTVITQGCLAAGDGGGGSWYWNPASTATDNTGTVLKPTGYNGTGRWVRQWAGTVDVRWFGVIADGVTPDTGPLQAALNTVASGGVLRIPAGTYAATALTHSTLSHVVIEAEGATLKCIAPAVTTQSQNFIVLGGSHVILRGGCIDANRRVNIALRIERAFNHVTIDSVEVKNVYDNAFTADAETVALRIAGAGSHCTIHKCTIHDAEATSNSIEGDRKGVSRGIMSQYDQGSGDISSKDVVITECEIYNIHPYEDGDAVFFGVDMTGQYSDDYRCVVENCYIHDFGKRGIKSMLPGVSLRDNKLLNISGAASYNLSPYAAISIYAGNNVITGNTISADTLKSTISVEAGSGDINDVVIADNRLELGYGGATSYDYWHVLLRGTLDYKIHRAIVKGNIFIKGSFAIDLSTHCTNIQIANNTATSTNFVYAQKSAGVSGDYTDINNINIINNIFTKTVSAAGVGVASIGKNWVIIGNTLTSSDSAALYSNIPKEAIVIGNYGVSEKIRGIYVPIFSTLPFQSSDARYRMFCVPGDDGVADKVYITLKNADGSYSNVQIAP